MGRSKVEIVHDILQVAESNTNCKKTTIIRLANLDWNMANNYLESLISDDLLEKHPESEKGSSEIYTITGEGKKLLRALKKLKNRVSIFRKD